LSREQLVLAAWHCRFPFRSDSEDISGRKRCCGDKPPTLSPDFAPADLFLFPAVKTALKRKRFQDVEDIKINVMAELKAELEAFADCFQKLFKRRNKCI
jgi:hypothetical protein